MIIERQKDKSLLACALARKAPAVPKNAPNTARKLRGGKQQDPMY